MMHCYVTLFCFLSNRKVRNYRKRERKQRCGEQSRGKRGEGETKNQQSKQIVVFEEEKENWSWSLEGITYISNC